MFEALVALQSWHLFDGLALARWRLGDPAGAIAAQRRALSVCIATDLEGLCRALASIRLGKYLLGNAKEEARSR
ncbi:MAG: hypothetical protein RMJ98_02985 [Myxococcales bacterium]|nr:hypothetical protein [Polyangiaceae bacterium]MDW8248255.1 hypothetical protein [Myxococcales bacterium]